MWLSSVRCFKKKTRLRGLTQKYYESGWYRSDKCYKRNYEIMKWNLTYVGSCQKKKPAGFFFSLFPTEAPTSNWRESYAILCNDYCRRSSQQIIITLNCLKHSEINATKNVLPPPKKKKSIDFFLGGKLFFRDPLESSDHPNIIDGCLKVV